MGIPITPLFAKSDLKRVCCRLPRAGLIVDAIFGIGLNKPVSGIYADVINMINLSGVPVLSVDIPSGLCAATGKIFNVCVAARITVTFGAAKRGFFTPEGKKYTGRVIVADISLPRALLASTTEVRGTTTRFAR
jgi:Uncharacterized conserved protein